MDELPEDYKNLLRLLVSLSRKLGREEFHLAWSNPPYIMLDDKKSADVPGASQLAFDYLEKRGFIICKPKLETRVMQKNAIAVFARGKPNSNSTHSETQYHTEFGREFRVTPSAFRLVDSNFATAPQFNVQRAPVEITESLQRLRGEFPEQSKLVFLMMQFGSSAAHTEIHQAIRSAMDPHGFVVLRADERQYHDDLFFNILTHIYGAQFGIAVFDRIDHESFNPNVSLEVGYMLGLNKSVCLLKDKSLKTLPSDLAGRLYQGFDVHNAKETIANQLYDWLAKKGFIYRPHV